MENLKNSKCEEITFLLERAIRMIAKKRGNSFYDYSKVGNQSFYSVQVNQFLMKNCLEAMPPLLEDKWPKEFKDMVVFHPKTSYSYVNSVLGPPYIRLPLYFGYAIINGELKKTSFFLLSDNEVIDPISAINRIKPNYYFGTPVNKTDLEVYMCTFNDPLESFVNRRKASKPFSRYSHHAFASDGSEYL